MDPRGVPRGSRGYGWVRIFEDLLIAAVIAPKTQFLEPFYEQKWLCKKSEFVYNLRKGLS